MRSESSLELLEGALKQDYPDLRDLAARCM